MRKHELVTTIVEGMKEADRKVSQEVVRDFLTVLENTVDSIIENREELVLAGMKISTKETNVRTYTSNFGSNAGQTITVPAKVVPVVKFLGSKKDQLSKEI